MEEILERCTKAELIALIHQMVDRYPDLELLIIRSAVGDAEERPAVDPLVISRQVDNVFYEAEDNRQSAFDVAWKLEEVVKVGDDYAGQEDWPNAATVYENVAQGVLDNYEMIYDHDGDLSWKVNDCVKGLGRCLAGTEDPARRETLLRALFDIYHWDVNIWRCGNWRDGGLHAAFSGRTLCIPRLWQPGRGVDSRTDAGRP